MAVIRTSDTSNTSDLVQSLIFKVASATGLMGDSSASAGVAQAAYLVDQLAMAKSNNAWSGVSGDGAETWVTEQTATAASYAVTDKNYEKDEGSGWLRTGTEKYAFAGTNLDQADSALATSFTYNNKFTASKDVPGYFGSASGLDSISAKIEYNLAAPDGSFKLKDFTASSSGRESGSGFGRIFYDNYDNYDNGGTFTNTDSRSIAFTGTYDFTSGRMVQSTLSSLSEKGSYSNSSDGGGGEGAYSESGTGSFSLTSAKALDTKSPYLDSLGNWVDGTITGNVTTLFYSDKGTWKEDGKSGSWEESFQYTDTAATTDDLDASKFAAYLNSWSGADLEALRAELFKGNDTITGSSINSNTLWAGGGDDKVAGNIGRDTLYGEAGNDTLNGGLGNDYLYGGADNDTLDGGADNDTLRGEAGNDVLQGSAGNDTLEGGDDDDRLDGGVGNDILDGGTGKDVLLGGVGNDRLVGGDGDDSLDGGAGNDALQGSAGKDVLLGGAGHDRLDGGEGDDSLDGGAGNDALLGGVGNDTLLGGTGNDGLDAGDGDDTLNGGAGNDVLTGGAGQDTLTGGLGSDEFVFGYGDSGDAGLSAASLDVVTDFSIDQDTIVFGFLSQSGADPLAITVLKATDGSGGSATYESLLALANDQFSSGKNVVVGYDSANAYVFADFDGGGADVAIQLTGIKGDSAVAAIEFDHLG